MNNVARQIWDGQCHYRYNNTLPSVVLNVQRHNRVYKLQD